MPRRALALLLALLALPGAAQALPASMRLDVQEARLQGEATFSSGRGVLDLEAMVLGDHGVVLRWDSASGYQVTRRWGYTGPPSLAVADPIHTPANRTLAYGPGSLENLTCAKECRVILFADGEGNVSLSGGVDAALARLAQARAWGAAGAGSEEENTFFRQADPGWLVASGGGAGTVLSGARVGASGRVSLFIANLAAEVHEGARSAPLDTRSRNETRSQAGLATGHVLEMRYAVLHLEGARVEAAEGAPAILYAPVADISWSGALETPRAEGVILVGGERHEIRGASLRMVGEMRGPVALARGLDAPVAPGVVGAESLEASGSGDLSDLLVGGRRLASDSPANVALASGLTLAAFALLVWLVLAKGGLTALYLRVDRETVMENPNRLRILAALGQAPGSSVADLVRATGIPQVVVRHHLKMLLAHNLVLRQSSGRRRLYSLRAQAQAAPIRFALKTDARRAVAVALSASAQPLSQKELAQQTGLQQRLVSYHLRLLRKEGLVESSGSMPRRYRPSPRLSTYLAAQGSTGPDDPGHGSSLA